VIDALSNLTLDRTINPVAPTLAGAMKSIAASGPAGPVRGRGRWFQAETAGVRRLASSVGMLSSW
jgi:hypothetical protein